MRVVAAAGGSSFAKHKHWWLWVPDRARHRAARSLSSGAHSRDPLAQTVGSLVRDDDMVAYVLKKLLAASREARFLVMATCSRSISELISAMRSASSSTDSSDRSCPISWVIFFLGLSSSSIAMDSPR